MSTLLPQPIDALCISAMQGLERAMQSVCAPGYEHDMHMVRHQAVGDYLDPKVAGILVQQVEIGRPVARTVEYTFAAIPALRNVMGHTRKYDACMPRHMGTLQRGARTRGVYSCAI